MTEQNPETPDKEPEQQIEEQEQQAAEEQVVYSSGSILKQAREDLGLSIEELAEQIRVPLNVLEAIEIDKVPKNLPETFIRGYIRSYARKVNVDEAIVLPEVETVAAINQTTSQSNMQSFSRRTRRKTLEKRLWYFTWLVVVAVVIAVVYWWFQDSERSNFAPVVETEQSVTSPAVINATPIEVEQPIAGSDNGQQTDGGSSVAEVSETEAEPTEQELSSDQPVELTEEQKALVADNGEPDEAGFLKVEMQFESECWVEVYDVAGERIAVGNKPAGYLMSLNAQGPLNVLLGNPAGVSIWVNGKSYDMSDKPRNRIARFELEAM